MEYRYLGRPGLEEQDDATRQIDLCLDAGINLIDTANVYNAGVSEDMIGVALAEGPNEIGLSRHHIVAQAEANLKRLKTDVIDLYQVHEWDGMTPIDETMEALDTLIKQGKVRYIGCSNYSGWPIMKALQAAGARHGERFISQQIHYTPHSREAEYELIPISQDQGLIMLIWSPLAGGLLSGKYRRDGGPKSRRHVGGFREPPVHDWEKLYDIVDVIVAIADGRGVSGGTGSAGLAAWPSRRDLGHYRRTQRGAVPGQSSGGRLQAQCRGARQARCREPAAADLPWRQTFTANDRLEPADRDLLTPYAEEFKRG